MWGGAKEGCLRVNRSQVRVLGRSIRAIVASTQENVCFFEISLKVRIQTRRARRDVSETWNDVKLE